MGINSLSTCDLGAPQPFKLCVLHTPEQYAEAALRLEPRGAFWCTNFGTVKAALYRAFGGLLTQVEKHLCKLYQESLGCGAVELLGEFEADYGLPSACTTNYPTDLAGRQAMVCAAIKGQGIATIKALEDLLKTALNCPLLTLENFYTHNTVGAGVGQPLMVLGGICVRGIGPAPVQTTIHNVVGGWGILNGTSTTAPNGSSVGQPLTLNDPSYNPPDQCPILYHSTVGGWTGGVGKPLTTGEPVSLNVLTCLMDKHLPAHITWTVCPI